jgi:hypothetical protein
VERSRVSVAGAWLPSRSVFVSSNGSRTTVVKASAIVLPMTVSSSSLPLGCPTLMTATPPGASRSPAREKNSLVVR